MTRQDVEAIFTRRHEALARHDADAAGAVYAVDAVVESPIGGGTVRGRDANTEVIRALLRAFPDVAFEMEALVVDGDRVAEQTAMSGTDNGGFMGMPPTRKPFHLRLVSMCQVRDGEIVYERRIYDFTGMLLQIGVLRAKPA